MVEQRRARDLSFPPPRSVIISNPCLPRSQPLSSPPSSQLNAMHITAATAKPTVKARLPHMTVAQPVGARSMPSDKSIAVYQTLATDVTPTSGL